MLQLGCLGLLLVLLLDGICVLPTLLLLSFLGVLL